MIFGTAAAGVCTGWTVKTIRVRLVRSGIEGRLVVLWISYRSLDFGVDVAVIERTVECGREKEGGL